MNTPNVNPRELIRNTFMTEGIPIKLFGAAFFACCIAIAESGTPRQNMEKADALLASERMFDLLEEAQREHWTMWPIHSAWAINKMPAGENKLADEKAATFAFNLSHQLDRLALSLYSPVANGQDERVAIWLAELGQWLGSAPGSGNALLAQRSLDLATLPLARLVADQATTDLQLLKYRSILNSEWVGVGYRAQVLNAETGLHFFDPEGSEEEFRSAYQLQVGAASRSTLEKTGVKFEGDPLLKSLPKASSAQDNSGFFDKESEPSIPTTTNCLGMKNHAVIASGLVNVNGNFLLALINYRLRAGRLPVVPQGKNTSQAFIDEWEKLLTLTELEDAEQRRLGGTAGRAYERIKDGLFIDQDSFYSRRDRPATLLPLKIPSQIQIAELKLPSGGRSSLPTKQREAKTPASEKSTALLPWFDWIVIILVVTGFLWLLISIRRTRTE